MNKQELKKMIKSLVRESLIEIFAEMHLETIVESVINKRKNNSLRQQLSTPLIENDISEVESISPEERKRLIMEKIDVDDDTWNNIYSDTIESNNPIINNEDNSKPELVPENVLKQSGLFRDYSKFVK